MKNQKGITLIALVITIIVLLILAGVSIAMLTDPNNGILTQATRAKNNTSEAEIADRINMALNGAYATILGEEKIQSEEEIKSENGLTTEEYNVQTNSVPENPTENVDVIVIKHIKTEKAGKIIYNSATKKYKIEKANYPQRTTENTTGNTTPES